MKRAFTLVELMVVITIITVLLALLTPGLDRAIYRAELTACAAGLRGTATSSLTYASANRRAFPIPPAGRLSQPYQLGQYNNPNQSLLPILRSYIPLKAWLDPMCDEVPLDEPSNDPDTIIAASYTYWAGWSYAGVESAGGGLRRIGDRLGWIDRTSHSTTTHTDYSDILMTDFNGVHANNNQVYISHPDDAGVTAIDKLHNDPLSLWGLELTGTVKLSWVLWRSQAPLQGVTKARGKVDLNFAMVDNAVVQYDGITGDWVANDFESGDGTQFHAAPWDVAANNPNAKYWMPLR